MIILDIETTGLNFNKNAIIEIGAIDLDNPKNNFLQNCKINKENEISQQALEVTGITKEELTNPLKQTEKELIENFFQWVGNIKIKNCICQNPQFDLGFISTKARKYNSTIPFPHRAFDLHSIASLKYFQIKKDFLIKDNKSNMGLKNILEFCGLKDNRDKHNALEDCKLTGECFSRIVYGKNLFKEYQNFPLPEHLQ